MKSLFKKHAIKILWWQVRRLREKNSSLVVIGVAGSVGKTSTKNAVAKTLSVKYRVAWQEGNYNDVVSIPLVFFDNKMPTLFNPIAWTVLLLKNEKQIRGHYNKQVVVLELGTDHSGDMAQLRGKLKVDYTLLTAISPEHMANFKDIDDVAKDELIATELADRTLADIDSVDDKYAMSIKNLRTISTIKGDLVISVGDLKNYQRNVEFKISDKKITIKTPLVGRHNISSLGFAAAIGLELGLSDEQLKSGLESIKASEGRMNVLDGKSGSKLIDDTYNSSPHAVKAALDTTYEIKAKHKIAVLGQMNELGSFSKELHEEAGEYCQPKQLDLVVTVGGDANKYLAKTAEERGCKVVRCLSPYHAADLVMPFLNPDTVVLLKGSQNGVFTEEATKLLLRNPEDTSRLVRQSDSWSKIKKQQFKDYI